MAIKPNFLTSMGYHIFLDMVLRARAFGARGAPLLMNDLVTGEKSLPVRRILLKTPKVTRLSAASCITIKDGAYYCYWAYLLRISRYSDFLSPMLTNTGIFLRGLKLSGESRS